MSRPPPPPTIVFWMIWFAILSSVLVVQFVIGGGLPSGENEGDPGLIGLCLSIAVVAVATVVRWMVIPLLGKREHLLVAMVVGIAMAESAEFFQLFLIGDSYPETQRLVFILCVLGVAQFAPVFLKRTEPR